jgi:hypothetical protein
MKKNALAAGDYQGENSTTEIPAIYSGFSKLASLDVRIAPNRIHFLKFILEAYDNLAVLSTIDPQQGLVRLRFPGEVRNELLALLHDLGGQLGGIDWLNVSHEV